MWTQTVFLHSSQSTLTKKREINLVHFSIDILQEISFLLTIGALEIKKLYSMSLRQFTEYWEKQSTCNSEVMLSAMGNPNKEYLFQTRGSESFSEIEDW